MLFTRSGHGRVRRKACRSVDVSGLRYRSLTCLLATVLMLASVPATAGTVRSAAADTGLVKWHFTEDDLEIELIQRLPDQTRGLFLARGFSREVTDAIATSCVFQTIVRNRDESGSGAPLNVDLRQWRMQHAGKETGIDLKEKWIDAWSKDEVSPAAVLAFRWATFPTQQEFLPGDYNWGMTLYGLPPAAVFDLQVVWQAEQQLRSAWIRKIECPPDVERLQDSP